MLTGFWRLTDELENRFTYTLSVKITCYSPSLQRDETEQGGPSAGATFGL